MGSSSAVAVPRKRRQDDKVPMLYIAVTLKNRERRTTATVSLSHANCSHHVPIDRDNRTFLSPPNKKCHRALLFPSEPSRTLADSFHIETLLVFKADSWGMSPENAEVTGSTQQAFAFLIMSALQSHVMAFMRLLSA